MTVAAAVTARRFVPDDETEPTLALNREPQPPSLTRLFRFNGWQSRRSPSGTAPSPLARRAVRCAGKSAGAYGGTVA
jgi:hypothetical protein